MSKRGGFRKPELDSKEAKVIFKRLFGYILKKYKFHCLAVGIIL